MNRKDEILSWLHSKRFNIAHTNDGFVAVDPWGGLIVSNCKRTALRWISPLTGGRKELVIRGRPGLEWFIENVGRYQSQAFSPTYYRGEPSAKSK